MNTESQWGILYYKGKAGKLCQWQCWADHDQVFTRFGQVGGKLQTTPGKKCQATNVGRANERDAFDQANFEAKALWENKVTRKYSTTPEKAAEQLFLPMLAHSIDKAKNVKFPADSQPKFDGVRCISFLEDGVVTLMSRSGKPYSVPHIEEALKPLLQEGDVFDGELYRLGVSCQTCSSWVKRIQPDTLNLNYHVYDMPSVAGVDSLVWTERYAAYTNRLLNSRLDHSGPVKAVEAYRQNSLEDIQVFQRYCVEQGYEGAMLRALDGKYEWGYRSKNLLKVKTFCDSEFLITGAREGEGKMSGAVVFRCRNDLTEVEFDVSMAATMEERQRYWRERDQYIGRKLTVKYFDRTEDQLPRFPVGVVVREDADLP